ncbi:unnamed protein product [Cylindrotheca closterium]|uniref:Uncharacterized protein n=1 Tax=Cylindrotheca closterium TaxID=2856 RepID=A0AAD2FQ87_9STRA|nr:unnamed protein product [Cylindrotheca closterium]
MIIEIEDSEASRASDTVEDLPTYDNEDPRAAFSGLSSDRILALTATGLSQGSSMMASESTLPSIDHEKDKEHISKLDDNSGSMQVTKLNPPQRPSTEPIQDQQQNGPKVSLSAAQILALSGDMAASRSAKKSNPRNSKVAVPNSSDTFATPKPVYPQPNDDAVARNDAQEDRGPTNASSMRSPGAYQVEGTQSTLSQNLGPAPPSPTLPSGRHSKGEQSVVMASAIDKEALKEELRQELLAEQTAAHVVMAVPAGTDDENRDSGDDEKHQTRSPRTSFRTNRRWWILLLMVFLLVGGAVAVAIIVTNNNSSSTSIATDKDDEKPPRNSGSGGDGGGSGKGGGKDGGD